MTCKPEDHEPANVTIPVVMSTSDTGWDDVQQVALTLPSPTPHVADRRLPVAICLKCGVLYLPPEELAEVREWVKTAYEEAVCRSKQAAEWEAKKKVRKT